MEILIDFVLLSSTAFTALAFFIAAAQDVKSSYFVVSMICVLAFLLRVALMVGALISFGA